MKRLLSIALIMVMLVGIVPFGVKAEASEARYNPTSALRYADANWDNGVGLCAEFVSRCLQAGGVDVFKERVIDLYEALNGTYGKAYKLKLTNETSGAIYMPDNEGKLSKGDPVFYKCNICGDFEHVVICNGQNSDGYCIDYAHNNPHNGYKTTYTYSHCGRDSWTMYSIKMETGPRLYGKKNSVGVPKISSLSNGKDGIVIKWSEVKKADKYRIYTQSGDTLTKIGETTDLKFTHTNVKDGKSYRYVVRAVDGKKYSQYYAGEKIKCIGIPELKSIKNVTDGVKISWEKVPSADGYIVYRGTGHGWERIAKIKDDKASAYTDKDVKNNKNFKYTVVPYKGKVKGCYDNSGIKYLFLSVPGKLSTKSTEEGVVISYGKISGADGYRIYRLNSKGKWSRLGDVVGGKTLSFVDVDVEQGESYAYIVKAKKSIFFSAFKPEGVSCTYDYVKPTEPEKPTKPQAPTESEIPTEPELPQTPAEPQIPVTEGVTEAAVIPA